MNARTTLTALLLGAALLGGCSKSARQIRQIAIAENTARLENAYFTDSTQIMDQTVKGVSGYSLFINGESRKYGFDPMRVRRLVDRYNGITHVGKNQAVIHGQFFGPAVVVHVPALEDYVARRSANQQSAQER